MNRNINRVRRAYAVVLRLLPILACAAALGGGLDASEPAAAIPGRLAPRWAATVGAVDPAQDRLSSRLIAATRTLFAQGLADPRGCEYREIKTCDPEADGGVATSHGWVLPTDPARKERFAIGWDGLVYPLLAVGPAADLRADVAEAAKGDQRTLLRLSLLLRLGEARLAEQYFDQVAAGPDRDELCDPYLLLAQEWTASLFSRAARAHQPGRRPLGMLTALLPAWEAVEAEATELDLPHEKPEQPFANAHSAEIPLYLKDSARFD